MQIANTAATPTVAPRKARKVWLGIVGVVVLVIAVVVAGGIYYMSYVPDDLDLSTSLPTEQGLYQVAYTAEINPIPINQIQQWTLHLEDATGQPVEDAKITVDGDMPQHGHGLPTRPQVTRFLGNGDYVVEGLKFHMPGWWVVDFQIEAGGKQDQVRFNLLLQ